jgi:hypothetical protein
MRRLAAVCLTLAATAAVPALAQASDYYVTPTGSDANDCITPATACATFAHVENLIIFDTSAAKTLHIAAVNGSSPATYLQPLQVGNNAHFDNLTIDGSYLGTSGQRATITVPGSMNGTTPFTDDGIDGVVKNLDVSLANGSGQVFVVDGDGTQVQDVAVTLNQSGNSDVAAVGGTGQTWDRVTVDTNGVGPALRATQSAVGTLTVRDSKITSTNYVNAGVGAPTIDDQSSLSLIRTKVSEAAASGDNDPAIQVFSSSGNPSPTVTLEDSLITGGAAGLFVKDPTLGADVETPHVIVRSSTIDAGAVDDSLPAGRPSIRLFTQKATSVETADVSNSILVDGVQEAPFAGSTTTITCTNTDVPASAGAPACQPTDATNESTPYADLFVLAPNDYSLLATAPAIDKGTALGAGESATDLAGAPRAVAINACPAVRDLGAYELQSPVKDCSTGTTGSTGATGTSGTSGTSGTTGATGGTGTPGRGTTGASGPTGPVATPPLKLAGAKLAAKTFTAKAGTRIALRLSRGARVTGTITATFAGHKKGKKCSLTAKTGKRCSVKFKKIVSFTGRTGANSFKLAARSLRVGRYRLTLIARSGAGVTRAVTLSFTVKAPPKKAASKK